jgi:alpha-beta hydrolase superfamily lysophospholipase
MDLEALIEYGLNHLDFSNKNVFLYGRSMGAVTSLLYLSNEHMKFSSTIKGLILDSPFSNLQNLVKEVCSQGILASILFNTLYTTIK